MGLPWLSLSASIQEYYPAAMNMTLSYFEKKKKNRKEHSLNYIQIEFQNLNKEISKAVSLELAHINLCTRKVSDSPGSICLFITFVKTLKDHRRLVSHNYTSSVCCAS